MKKSGDKNKRNRHELSSLKEENRILRAEIKRLNRVLRMYSASNSSVNDPKDKRREVKLFDEALSFSVALASSSYLKYLLARLSAASVYSLIQKAIKGFRRFKLVSTVLRVISYILAVLGTSAFFLFISGALIFMIPLLLLICASAYLASMLFRKKAFKELARRVEGKRIFVLFPTAGKSFKNGSQFRKSLSIIKDNANNDALIITVSPFLLSSKGFGGKGYFPVMRMEEDGLFIIRRNAFFALRKRLTSKKCAPVTYIY